tara:strand:+ start:12285 stop:12761 length:477 start_codon:yes stop_codon:yes gene_type:complete
MNKKNIYINYIEMAEIENIFIKPVSEEELVEEPKKKGRPKRQLTEKQLEALAKGRDRVKKNREAKLKSSQELKKEQRAEKKELTKRQKAALEKVKKNKALDLWDEKKSKVLETMPDEDSFNTLKNYLDTISEDDIMDEKKLKFKLANMAHHLHMRTQD